MKTSLLKHLLPKLLLLTTLASGALLPAAHAATLTWAGAGGAAWDTPPSNWSPPGPPLITDDALFPSTLTPAQNQVVLGLPGTPAKAINSLIFSMVNVDFNVGQAGPPPSALTPELILQSSVTQTGLRRAIIHPQIRCGPTLTLNGPGTGPVRFNGDILGMPNVVMNGGDYGIGTVSGPLTLNGIAYTAAGGSLEIGVTNTVTVNTPVTIVAGGTLRLCSLGNAAGVFTAPPITVLAGGTITVSVPVISTTIIIGGAAGVGCSPGTFDLTGNLILGPTATLEFELATAGIVGGPNDLIEVTGNVQLNGTLNVTGLSGFGAGIFRLINYTGTLTGSGLTVGSMPAGFNYLIDTATLGEVNLVVSPLIQSYTINILPGQNLIANHLNHGDNSLDVVLADVPAGSQLYFFRNGQFEVYSRDDFGWDLPTTFAPREAAFLYNPGPAYPLTFVGAVPANPPPLSELEPEQFYYLSAPTAQRARFGDLTGHTPETGTRLLRWDPASQSYLTHLCVACNVWEPAEPVLEIGEGAVVVLPGGTPPVPPSPLPLKQFCGKLYCISGGVTQALGGFSITVKMMGGTWLNIVQTTTTQADGSYCVPLYSECNMPWPTYITVTTPACPGQTFTFQYIINQHGLVIPPFYCSNCNACTTVQNVETLFSGRGPSGLLAVGALDPQFATGLPPFTTPQPYVTTASAGWLANDPNSRWVGPDPAFNSPADVFCYTNQFHLPCIDRAEITGQWSVAGEGGIFLNGANTGVTLTSAGTAWQPVNITSGFVPGLNTLVFCVTNPPGGVFSGNPTGLRTELSVKATCCEGCVTIRCPNDILAEICTNATTLGVVTNYPAPVASSACGQITNVQCVPPSGSYFPLGTNVVICTATDSLGNTASCSFKVIVKPKFPFKVLCPPFTLSVTGCPPVLPNLFALATIMTNCPFAGSITVTNYGNNGIITNGTPLPPGQTVVTIQIYYNGVRVTDCDVVITAYYPPGCCTTNQVLQLFSGAYSAGLLPGGALDPQFNTGLPIFTTPNPYVPSPIHPVWVPNLPTDNSKWVGPVPGFTGSPVGVFTYTNHFFVCSTNQAMITGRWSVDDAGSIKLNGTTVASVPGVAGTCACALWHPVNITSGFMNGWNELVFYVTNGVASSVTGLRTELTGTACCQPCLDIACPPNRVDYSCYGSIPVNYTTPTATSTCGTTPTVTCVPPTGSLFPLGVTTVLCTASDGQGHRAGCSFTVTVLPQQNPPCIPMDIVVAGTNIVVCWPVGATNFELEATDSLSPPIVWVPVNAAVQEANGRRCVTMPYSGAKRFFRLRGPGEPHIPAGIDLFETVLGTYQDFNGTPIPAGFFGPGSEPFASRVDLLGSPLAAIQNIGQPDTIVQRLAPLTLSPGETGTVPIQLVALSLVGTAPITVTYGGGSSEQWNVRMDLSHGPQPLGTITITCNAAGNGGTFDSTLPVRPRLVFTRPSDGAQRILDFGDMGGMMPAIQLSVANVPWSTGPSTGNTVQSVMVSGDGSLSVVRIGPIIPMSYPCIGVQNSAGTICGMLCAENGKNVFYGISCSAEIWDYIGRAIVD